MSDKPTESETTKVLVEYAFCCPGSTRYCDCVNKNHGTALMSANEVGDDYIVVGPSPQTRGGGAMITTLLCHIGIHSWVPERYLTGNPHDDGTVCRRCWKVKR